MKNQKRTLGILVSVLALAALALFASCKDPYTNPPKKNYTVSFNKNHEDTDGWTEADPKTMTVTSPNKTLDRLPVPPTRTGYGFADWNTSPNGTGTVFTAFSTVTADIIVYAQWGTSSQALQSALEQADRSGGLPQRIVLFRYNGGGDLIQLSDFAATEIFSLTNDINNNPEYGPGEYVIVINTPENTINARHWDFTGITDKTVSIVGWGREKTVTVPAGDTGYVIGQNSGRLNLGHSEIDDARLTVRGLQNNTSAAVVSVDSELAMYKGAKVTGNSVSPANDTTPGGVDVRSGVFSLHGGEVSGNSAANIAGVYVGSGTFTMTSGFINGNTASGYIGGLLLQNSAAVISGGEINGNRANHAAGVELRQGATLEMIGGKITGNTAATGGGGAGILNGTITMTGGEIVGNTAAYGGGVLIDANGSFVMTGTAEIKGNTAGGFNGSNGGGGVYVFNNGTFAMSGGALTGNTAGVSVTGDSINGGGVYVLSGGTFAMSGGTISANACTGNGKGVYAGSDSVLSMSGTARMNTGNEVYMWSNVTIAIGGDLSGGVPVATLGLPSYSEGRTVLTGDTSLIAANCQKIFVLPSPDGRTWTIKPDGTISSGGFGGTGATVSGTITAAGAADLTQAEVQIRQNNSVRVTVRPASNGLFNIPNVPAGENYTIRVSLEGYSTETSDAFTVPGSGAVTGRNLTLRLLCRVGGRISLSDDGDVTQVEVRLRQNDTNVGAAVRPAADGAYAFADVPADTGYTVTASLAGYRSATSASFSASSDTADINLTLSLHTINGTITLTSGAGDVTAVTVRLRNEADTADAGDPVNPSADGTYSLPYTGTGRYMLVASLSGYTRESDTIFISGSSTDINNRNFNLRLLCAVSGTITLSGGTGNVTEVTVILAHTYGRVATVNPAANGTYTVPDVPAGLDYTVEASLYGYTTQTSAAFTVTGNVGGRNLTLPVTVQTYSISGTLILDGGTANVTSARVRLMQSVPGSGTLPVPGKEVTPAANGSYTITGVPAGDLYSVQGVLEDYVYYDYAYNGSHTSYIGTLSSNKTGVNPVLSYVYKTISGTVTAAPATNLSAAQVRLYRATINNNANNNVNYKIEELAVASVNGDGTWAISVRAQTTSLYVWVASVSLPGYGTEITEGMSIYDFYLSDYYKNKNVTLVPSTVDLYTGTIFEEEFADIDKTLVWLETIARDDTAYTVRLRANQTRSRNQMPFAGRTGINLTFEAAGTPVEISNDSAYRGSIFLISVGNTAILGNGVTLKGRNDNTSSLVTVSGGASFIMKEGSAIKDNTNSGTGGGGVSAPGVFIMEGGTISGNVGSNGGGVYVPNGGTFTMTGGTISGNTASAPDSSGTGGGVYVTSNSNNATFTMTGGEISGNTAVNGGGVCCYSSNVNYYYNAIFTMSGGTISGNTANSGGGVYSQAGNITMSSGAIISGNTAANNGGGVYSQTGIFRIVTGTIYGSNESNTSLRNNAANNGAALYLSANRYCQRGTFNGEMWNGKSDLSTTNDTVRVVNGMVEGDFTTINMQVWRNGNAVTLTAPTFIPIAGQTVTAQGWQTSDNGRSGWSNFTPPATAAMSHNGKYLRYYATLSGGTTSYSNTTIIQVLSATERGVTIAMWATSDSGWGSAALRINVNGTDRTTNASLATFRSSDYYIFAVNPGDVVQIYWIGGGYADGLNAFAVYYSDSPPPGFDPVTGTTGGNVLVFKQYSSGAVGDGTLMGSFTVP